MENTIIALGLFSLGLYIILNINNDVNTKCVKNSGYLELDNNVDINNNQVINDNKNSFTNTNSLNILNDQLNKNNNLNV